MEELIVNIGDIKVANNLPFVLFGGINVLESSDLAMLVCEHFLNITKKLGIPYIFKASFDKANRSSIYSYRGPGLRNGIKIFTEIKKNFDVKIITDVHEVGQAKELIGLIDVIQLPAFLARQTDLIVDIARTGAIVNVKKPQFISPKQIGDIVNKFRENNNHQIILCDRGTNFGYNNLVVDMLGFNTMKLVSGGCPIIFDVTHALQTRELLSKTSSGRREQISEIARAGLAIGISGLFVEAHPEPEKAKCDGLSALSLAKLEPFLYQMKAIDQLVKSFKEF